MFEPNNVSQASAVSVKQSIIVFGAPLSLDLGIKWRRSAIHTGGFRHCACICGDMLIP